MTVDVSLVTTAVSACTTSTPDLAGAHGQLVQLVLDEEGLQGGGRLGQRLAHPLRTLDEEPTVVLPHGALVQPRGGDDLRDS